jgi:hypothetical protein
MSTLTAIPFRTHLICNSLSSPINTIICRGISISLCYEYDELGTLLARALLREFLPRVPRKLGQVVRVTPHPVAGYQEMNFLHIQQRKK